MKRRHEKLSVIYLWDGFLPERRSTSPQPNDFLIKCKQTLFHEVTTTGLKFLMYSKFRIPVCSITYEPGCSLQCTNYSENKFKIHSKFLRLLDARSFHTPVKNVCFTFRESRPDPRIRLFSHQVGPTRNASRLICPEIAEYFREFLSVIL